ncbi:hypothetical protein VTK26DRAFT_6979 [Humicola hyalothermophila]
MSYFDPADMSPSGYCPYLGRYLRYMYLRGGGGPLLYYHCLSACISVRRLSYFYAYPRLTSYTTVSLCRACSVAGGRVTIGSFRRMERIVDKRKVGCIYSSCNI